MKRAAARSSRILIRAFLAASLSASLAGRGSVAAAGAPAISIAPTAVQIKIQESSLYDAVDALGRAANFKVVYDGARAPRMIYGVEITAPTVPQALFKLIDGQNLNYALTFDVSGKRITSLMILGAPKPSGPSTSATSSSTGRPQVFSTPRASRGDTLPPVDDDPNNPDDSPAESAAEAARAQAGNKEATPTPSPGIRTMSPFAPRPPFGPPPSRPTPSPSPSA